MGGIRPRLAPLLLALLVLPAAAGGLAGEGAAALSSSPASPWLASASPSSPCPGFTHVPGQGPSCPVEGGWRVLLPDGSSLLTHGPDPIPLGAGPAPGVAGSPTIFAPPVPPRCVDAPDEQAHLVIYARALDAPDRHEAMLPALREMVASVNGKLREESAAHGAALDYRVRCEADGQVRVANAVLPFPAAQADFSTIAGALQAQGFTSPFEKYWVWYDGRVACGCAGQGELKRDNLLRAENQNNLGPSFAMTYGYEGYWGAFVMMHEGGHVLGAVSFQAPHTSGAGHCNDGLDVMCYADGGPLSAYREDVCDVPYRFDCGSDTYFHPDPPPTAYLAKHWNLASPLDRFLQGCQRATLLVPGPFGFADLAIDPSCQGRPYAAFGHHGVVERYQTCWRDAEGALLACDDGNERGRAKVPEGAALATVSPLKGPGGRVTFAVA